MKSWNCKFITWLQLQTFWSSSVARRIFHWFFFQKRKKYITTTSCLVEMAVNIFRSRNLGKAANESSYSLTIKEKLIGLYCSYIWEKGTNSFFWTQTSFMCLLSAWPLNCVYDASRFQTTLFYLLSHLTSEVRWQLICNFSASSLQTTPIIFYQSFS